MSVYGAPALPRRRFIEACGLASLGALGACSTPSALPAGAASALAPTGRLRACINLGNPILAKRDAAGVVSGVSVDLATALAQQLGVPLDRVVVDAAAKSVETVKTGAADIGFFAIDPLRSQGIAFTAAYVLIEGAYLVRQDSPLTDKAQVDAGAQAAGGGQRRGGAGRQIARRCTGAERAQRGQGAGLDEAAARPRTGSGIDHARCCLHKCICY